MEWFRMYHEARNDRKLATLTDAEHRVWFDLMCLASDRREDRGTVSGYTPDLLALEVAHGDEALLDQTMKKLKALHIVVVEDDAVIFINWGKRQYDKPSDMPENVRRRVQKHRDEKVIKGEALQGVTSRYEAIRNDQNRTDTEQNRTEQSHAREPAPAAVAADKPAARQMWDALGSALGHTPQGNRSVERGRWNKAIASLLSDGETPETIGSLAKIYRDEWPDMECTPMALAANRSSLRAKADAPRSVYDSGLFKPGGYSKEEADAAERREAAKYKPPLALVTEAGMQQQDHRLDLTAMTKQLAARPPVHKNGTPPSGLKRPTYRLGE